MPTPFELRAEDVFHISGRGYVVVGKIGQGRVKVGDELVAKTSGGQQSCTVLSINVGKDMVDEAETGTDVGLMLRGFNPEKLKDAAGVPVWQGSTRVDLVLQGAGTAAPSGSMEESIARMRGEKKPWWKVW